MDRLDQLITDEINKILAKVRLSPEMTEMIKLSLNAECETGELFKWAHLTLMSCECIGGIAEAALPGAIAMELSALAADIFDDIQDQDNDVQPWRQILPENAMNLAICLSMLSYEAIRTLPEDKFKRFSGEVCRILSQMWISASDGQYQEFLYDDRDDVTFDEYFELVQRKSGSLVAGACKIGATLGGAAEPLVLQMEQFGYNLGIMSQIRNDLNDFLDFEKKKDFANKKKTLPYIYLLNIPEGSEADRFKELIRIDRNAFQRLGREEQEYLKQLAINEGAIHYCRVMYELFREKSRETLLAIPVSEKYKEKMIKLVKENI